MEPSESTDTFSVSLEQVLEQLAELMADESEGTGKIWFQRSELDGLFTHRWGFSLETYFEQQDFTTSLRQVLSRQGYFRIYGDQGVHDFYVQFLPEAFLTRKMSGAPNVQYHIKRPWRIDGRLVKMLQDEGAIDLAPPGSRSPASQPRSPHPQEVQRWNVQPDPPRCHESVSRRTRKRRRQKDAE